VYGLSFFIILLNVLLYHIFFKHHNKSNVFLKWEILAVALIAGGTLAYGHYRLSEDQLEKKSRQHIKFVVIQANIDQSIKWDPAYQSKTIFTYQRLTRAAFDFKPEVIVWPETAVPFFFQNNVELSPKVFSLAKKSGAILIFGSPDYERIGGMTKYYDRTYLITPKGHPVQYYDKVHLVPFGEYVPLKRLLFFVNRLVPAAGDFEEGNKITPLKHRNLSFGTLICYEAIFPELARAHVRRGANMLVNLTNDAWFGMTSAPYQHLSMAVFRTVENRRPMIRSANTGFSAYIAPQGEIVALSTLFSQDCLKVSIGLPKSPLTFYARFGDLFAISLLIISFIKVLSCLWTKWIKPGQGHMTQKGGK
ncbi:apolipoprotein N-acyltransferase, partial [bacterium]|nr:apolipoprotein N-acyltransferase [bacterium]